MTRRMRLLTLSVAAAALLSACTSPPPALPKYVLDSGEKGLSKEHPQLTEAQRKDCRSCHMEAKAPKRP